MPGETLGETALEPARDVALDWAGIGSVASTVPLGILAADSTTACTDAVTLDLSFERSRASDDEVDCFGVDGCEFSESEGEETEKVQPYFHDIQDHTIGDNRRIKKSPKTYLDLPWGSRQMLVGVSFDGYFHWLYQSNSLGHSAIQQGQIAPWNHASGVVQELASPQSVEAGRQL
jgi:hypothetical protein